MPNAHTIPAVPTGTNRPTALIWRMRLLPVSETFILKQASALIRFSPFLAGRRRVKGLDTPEDLSWTINRGGLSGLLKEVAFLYRGPSDQAIRALASRRPWLLHAHFGVDAARALKLASALGVPLITTFHGHDITRTDEALRRTRDGRFYLKHRRALQTRGAHFIAVSRFIRTHSIDSTLRIRRLDTRRSGNVRGTRGPTRWKAAARSELTPPEASPPWLAGTKSDRLIGVPQRNRESRGLRSHGGHTTGFYTGLKRILPEQGGLK